MILGEEGGVLGGGDPRFRWLVDPLDGTTNYTHGFPLFCVSIGFQIEGRLQFGVVNAAEQSRGVARGADRQPGLVGGDGAVEETHALIDEMAQRFLRGGLGF